MSITHPSDLCLTVAGQRITHHQLCDALADLGTSFKRSAFQSALSAQPVTIPITTDVTRRVLQHLRRRGAIQYDRAAESWRVIAAPMAIAPNQTLPLTIVPEEPLPDILPDQTSKPVERTTPKPPSRLDLRAVGQSFLAYFACTAIVVALVTINAGFAWELAESEAFRFAFVAGLMACDLMRPLLVARGLYEIDRHRVFRGSAAILVAVSLAPVSVLSSTSVIGATLHLGVEENDQAAARAASLEALRPEHDRLKAQGADLWQAYRDECARGGCGTIAAGIKVKAEAANAQAAKVLAEIVALTGPGNENSAFIARTVKSFEDLSLFGPDRTMLIPLLLALTLEVAALFGPGLLLSRQRVSRATL